MSVRHTAPLLISGAEECQLVSRQARQYSPVPATPQPLTQLWCPPAVNKLAVVLRHGAARAAALSDKIDESVFGDAVQLLQRSPEHERVHTPNTKTSLQQKINKAATGGICDEDGEGEARGRQVNGDERGRNRYCRNAVEVEIEQRKNITGSGGGKFQSVRKAMK